MGNWTRLSGWWRHTWFWDLKSVTAGIDIALQYLLIKMKKLPGCGIKGAIVFLFEEKFLLQYRNVRDCYSCSILWSQQGLGPELVAKNKRNSDTNFAWNVFERRWVKVKIGWLGSIMSPGPFWLSTVLLSNISERLCLSPLISPLNIDDIIEKQFDNFMFKAPTILQLDGFSYVTFYPSRRISYW